MLSNLKQFAARPVHHANDRQQGPPPCGLKYSTPQKPDRLQTTRRNRWNVALAAALALAGLGTSGVGTSRAQDSQTVSREFRGKLEGNFSTIAPRPLLTLADSVKGHATVFKEVTGSFTVIIHFTHPVADGFVLVSKTGSLVADNGERVDLAMVSTFNVTTFDVHYVFVVTGGTGRFAGATGNGTWDVPPPTVFETATGSGSGPELFDGVITLPKAD
jgi:hypothetical protein